eukprot:GHVS01018537.1.p1 GENE.GHVS01018537.1~~GHVS01018537.1.p1  ORF type:complete len:249 (-),score=52.40 GHVS01018537.1:58-804(-)
MQEVTSLQPRRVVCLLLLISHLLLSASFHIPPLLHHHLHPSFVLAKQSSDTILTTANYPSCGASSGASSGNTGDWHKWLIGIDFGFRSVGFAISPPPQFGYRNFKKDRKISKQKQINRITQLPPLLLPHQSHQPLIPTFLLHIAQTLPPLLHAPLSSLLLSQPSEVFFVLGKPNLPFSNRPPPSELSFMVTVCRDIGCALSTTTGCTALLVAEEFSSQAAHANIKHTPPHTDSKYICAHICAHLCKYM